MRVLLVGNYAYDRQQSMLRFASLLGDGLTRSQVDVATIRPRPFFGRLKPGGTGIGKWLGYIDKFLLFPPVLRRAAAGCDLVHLCDHSNAVYVPYIANRPHVVTCHDLLAVRSALGEFPENPVGWPGRKLQGWILGGLRQSRRIVADSIATRSDVVRLAGKAISEVPVVHPGLNPAYWPDEGGGRPVPGRYILHVGGGQWYKNREALLAVHGLLKERLGGRAPGLVLVGPRPLDVQEGVTVFETIDDDTLRRLYSNAELLLFPSLAEGYGWPIIEAQACGCRVAITRRAPMTELGGDAAVYFEDPTDADGIAGVVVGVLQQGEEKQRALVDAGLENARQFSVSAMVDGYLAIYREEAGGKQEGRFRGSKR